MARTCTICSHPQHTEIDVEIASGKAFAVISRDFAVSPDSIERHAASHIPKEIKESKVAQDSARAFDVVQQLRDINTTTLAILSESRAANKNGMALFAIDRLMKQLELQAKLLGDSDQPQEQEVQDGLVIPYDHLSAHERMKIRTILIEAEQRKERSG